MRFLINKNYIFIIILVSLISFLSFYPAFDFAFVVDDWNQLWGVFYDRSIIDYYIKTQHPNSAYEFLVLAPFFKFAPFYYQVVGYLLKVLDSLSVAFLIFHITRQKKAAFFSGLFFASSVMGIETFIRISAQNSALLIPTLSLGLYFWITANRKNSIYKYFLAVIFMALTIMGDPGIGMMVIPIAFVWSLLSIIQTPDKQTFKKFIITTIILISIPLVLKWYLDPRIADRNTYLSKHFNFVLSNIPQVTTNFLTSIGNLLIGWFIPVKENTNLTSPYFITIISGYFSLTITFILIFLFLKRKSEFLKISLFLSLWIFLFYFPNWFTQTHYVEGGVISAVSNRYLAISSIGLIGLIAYVISSLKKKTSLIVLSVGIFLNLWSSYRILKEEYKYRSVEVQDKLYKQIDEDLPKGGEEKRILLFLGDNWLRIVGLDWNGFFPLAVRRGITDRSKFSTIINSLEQAKSLVCINNKEESSKFKLSALYAWEVQDDKIYNVSENLRNIISTNQGCKFIP